MDCSPLGSSVHGLLQGRTLECVVIPFSRGSSWPRDQTQVSCIGRQILYRLSHQGGIRVWFGQELSVRRWHFDEEENSYLVSKYLSIKYFLVTKGKIVTVHLRTCWKCKLLSRVWLFATPPWNFPGQNTGVGSLSLLQGIFPAQVEPRSPALQADSLPAEPQGKPKNTGLASLSLLQGIFSTQELNRVSCIAWRFFTNWTIRETHWESGSYHINQMLKVNITVKWQTNNTCLLIKST